MLECDACSHCPCVMIGAGASAGPITRLLLMFLYVPVPVPVPMPVHAVCCAWADANRVTGDDAWGQEELEALSSRGLNESGYAYLTSMAVSPGWRRKGIASALLSAAERVAGKWWQNWVLLHVYDTDAAGEHAASPL